MFPRILVVDDSATVRQQVRVALESGGFDVIEAGDGLDGLKCIHGDPSIRAVICDVNMPRMTGLQMLAQFRSEGRPRVPVLMLSTEGHTPLLQKAKALGARGWIVKPFDPAVLVSAVRKLTEPG